MPRFASERSPHKERYDAKRVSRYRGNISAEYSKDREWQSPSEFSFPQKDYRLIGCRNDDRYKVANASMMKWQSYLASNQGFRVRVPVLAHR